MNVIGKLDMYWIMNDQAFLVRCCGRGRRCCIRRELLAPESLILSLFPKSLIRATDVFLRRNELMFKLVCNYIQHFLKSTPPLLFLSPPHMYENSYERGTCCQMAKLGIKRSLHLPFKVESLLSYTYSTLSWLGPLLAMSRGVFAPTHKLPSWAWCVQCNFWRQENILN